jgi:uncharacterized protein (DUF362 family)
VGEEGITRKEFLRLVAAGALAFGLEQVTSKVPALAAPAPPMVAVAKNQSPAALVRAAVGALGGMQRFVKPGQTVVVKPNAAWARTPAQAANTNPEVVAEIVRLCKQAGAKLVKVMDHAIDGPDNVTFRMNGIKEAAQRAGAVFISGSSSSRYTSFRIPRGKVLRASDVLRDIKEADVFINVPIAKVHGSVPLTIGLKNLMGVTFDRQAWHNSPDLNQAIADYATVIRPHLTIVDAVRVLLTNGPKGPGQTKDTRMVIAGVDPVAVDAYTTQQVFGMSPNSLRYLVLANAAGVGEINLRKIKVKSA